jgi:anti-sigma B factor antagonist
MQMRSEERNGVVLVLLEEERLDARIADQFKQAMGELIAAGGNRMVLDLSAVNFVDSSGLGAIVAALKTLDGNGQLVIAGLRDSTLAMFRLTRMDRVFSIYDDIDEAVVACAP